MKGKKRVVFATPTPPVLTERFRTEQMNALAKNPGIPVLTDIVQSVEKKPAAPTPAPLPTATVLEQLPWDELEERLTGRIRGQVMEHLNFVLDDNISQHVSSVLRQMAVMLAEEIKYDMQNTLEVIVTHTIATELQNLKQKKRQLENKPVPTEKPLK